MRRFYLFAAYISIILSILVLGSMAASAIAPITKYVAVRDTVDESDNTAIYKMSLTNLDSNDDRYQLYTISAFWDINPTIVTVPAGSTAVFDLEVSLNDRQLVGPQLVPVTVKSLNSEDFIIDNIYVYIKPSDGVKLSYTPNIAMTANMKEEIDPRNTTSLEINMRNRNQLDIKDLRIVIDSQLFNKEVQTTLGPLEEKTNQVLLGLNELQTPGIYLVNIKLMVANKTVAQTQKEVHVIGYSDVSVEKTNIKGLFSYAERIRLHNDGNFESVKNVRVEKNILERIFTSSTVKYDVVREDGVAYASWDIPLKPRETYDLTVKTDYTSLAILIIIIIAGIVLYYLLRSPVLLYKRAKIITSTDEGVSEIRVKLHLKNRSGKEIRNIKVVDRYPKIVSLVEDNSIGAMKPTKLLSADKVHSLLMWNLEALEPYEERLLSYTIKSQLNIVGNMHLHSAKVKFQSKSGDRTTSSNDVVLEHRSANTIKYD